MSGFSETIEINKTTEVSDETEGMDFSFEAELDSKCEEYTSKGRSLEDIQREKEELMQMKEVLIKYKDLQGTEFFDADDGDEDSKKVLILRR